ncbi:MAG: GNAT family N-acetyltransferase [Pelagimonas sp.]|jgi:predicted GNAT family N-acyltransferase|nr:GNAT family N-acetyltransferase [Pelagimonas sp.]
MAQNRVEIREITLDQALDVRHPVLWPDLTRDDNRVPGDESACHLGVCKDGRIVAVLSLYPDPIGWRIRKFACLPAYQGQGIGTALMRAALHRIDVKNGPKVWLSARLSAVPFYQRFGFATSGDSYDVRGVPAIRMIRTAPASPPQG